jgi:hypothetical protein
VALLVVVSCSSALEASEKPNMTGSNTGLIKKLQPVKQLSIHGTSI